MTVEYLKGQLPQLRLFDGDVDKKVISLTGWKTETIEEFLKDRVRPGPEA